MKMLKLKNRATFLSIFVLLTGCQSYSVRTEIGVAEPLAFPKITNIGGGNDITIIHKAIYFGGPVFNLSKNFIVDSFIGPSAEIVTDDYDTFGIGLDISPRLRYTYWRGVHPYFGLFLGSHYYHNKIGEQDTNWGFTLGGGPGLSFRITDSVWFYTEYRAWHESNGSEIFGSPKPNPGFNTDLFVFGFEYKF